MTTGEAKTPGMPDVMPFLLRKLAAAAELLLRARLRLADAGAKA